MLVLSVRLMSSDMSALCLMFVRLVRSDFIDELLSDLMSDEDEFTARLNFGKVPSDMKFCPPLAGQPAPGSSQKIALSTAPGSVS